MKKLLLTAALAAATLCASNVSAQEKTFIDQNYVEITGTAELEATPDEIYLAIVINEADSKGRTTLAQSERDMFSGFKNIGIDLEKDLTIGDMSSDFKTYVLRRNATLTSKTYQLKVTSATQLNDVFKVLADVGVSDVNILKVDLSNIEELQAEVRAKAVKNAQQTAASLVGAVGQKIGRAIFIQAYGYNIRPTNNMVLTRGVGVMMDAAAAVEETMPKLEFQKIKIEQAVLVRFVLE